MKFVILLRRIFLTGKNLFHRAIVQSGSALSSWGIATSPLRYARRLAEAVNCTADQSADLVDCFKKLSARSLVDADVHGAPYRYLSALGPTVDRRTVLPSTVRALMHSNVDSVLGTTPLLLGVTRDEGRIYLSQSDLDQVKSASRLPRWLGGLVVRRRTCDSMVVSSIPDRCTIGRLADFGRA